MLLTICKNLDWDTCINKRGNVEKKIVDVASTEPAATVDFTQPNLPVGKDEEEETTHSQTLYDGMVFKLHGDMDHSDRKVNFFGFDKA